jgi:phosphate starvation-inducible PhoH-like protein
MARRKTVPPGVKPPEFEGSEKKQFKFLTKAQEEAWNLINENDVVMLLGASGAGKTQIATAWANLATSSKKYKQVIHTRPVVEAYESLGWLPGSVEEKLAPYMLPLQQCSSKTRGAGIEVKVIPLAYMRGITMVDSIAILDEAQNCCYAQLKLFLTRFGHGSKMIICGDQDQADIKNSGLMEVYENLKDVPKVAAYFFKPEDTVRHPIVTQILKRLK